MKMIYCQNCRKETGHKRCLGWGTFFAACITFGFWLLIVPFYPLRCIICGADNVEPSNRSGNRNYLFQEKKWYKTWWGIALIILGFIIFSQIAKYLGVQPK